MTPRHICIHGHFYQPPRENPWLEEIEREESAHPFHDWNERIAYECYAPNAFARILDERGRIVRIVNNYARISFNFGPTLLAWMERKAPETYEAILAADEESRHRFGGHGSAMAQPYNHMILPLANARDRRTQILWGLEDFRQRFRREPEGMWLPETGADIATLEDLAEEGIRFTVLAPGQAKAVRPPDGEWTRLNGEMLDPSRPYRVSLPSGGEMVVFFYFGGLSRAVAFERLLNDGGGFARRLREAGRRWGAEGLTHIATDGETYGHHHRHGEMALAYALSELERDPKVKLTNYGEYLDLHPPTWEARIHDGSSWSCAHGVERWRSDCGCSTGGYPEWSQDWRTPLREALDRLRDRLEPLYENGARELFRDPWGARDRYIDVILNRTPERMEAFLREETGRTRDGDERTRALKLMELQRHAMLMYTSCGWFFDDLSGIESLQVLKYAARALHLAGILFDEDLEEEFREDLSQAKSNLPEEGSGRDLYDTRVRTVRVGLSNVAAHHAVASLFENGDGGERPVYCYSVTVQDARRLGAGRVRMALGRARITSRITFSTAEFTYAVLHMGDHNLVGGVRPYQNMELFRSLGARLAQKFEEAGFTDVIRILDQEFRAATYSLHSLFRDEQEWVVTRILRSTLEEAEGVLADLYENRAPLMRFLAELSMPQPGPLKTAGEFVVNTRLERALAARPPHLEQALALLAEARRTRLDLDEQSVAYEVGAALHDLLEKLEQAPDDRRHMEQVLAATELLEHLPFPSDLWWAQNHYFRVMERALPGVLSGGGAPSPEEATLPDPVADPEAHRRLQDLLRIGRRLSITVPELSRRTNAEEGVEA